MANIRSAEKQNRQAVKRQARNRAGKSHLKTALKRGRAAVAGGADKAKDAMSSTFAEVDRAAKRGIIKKNTANRYKSRLAKAAKRNTK